MSRMVSRTDAEQADPATEQRVLDQIKRIEEELERLKKHRLNEDSQYLVCERWLVKHAKIPVNRKAPPDPLLPTP